MSAGSRAAALVLATLAVLVLGPRATAAAAGNPYAADRVVVVGVPGLTWDDVDTGTTTPQLAALAREGAVGSVSVRAARRTTCLLDGWATLGAGNRAGFPGTRSCAAQQRAAVADPRAAVARVDADPGTRSYGGAGGALGRAVGCAGVAGPAAAVAVAAPGVRLASMPALPRTVPALDALLTACPLTLVAPDPATPAEAVDTAVGRLRAAVAALPGRTLLLVVGVSEVGSGRPELHAGIATGPGFAPGTWLTSAATGRAPYVELIDVAPTVLRALGRAAPASMNGQPMRSAGTRPPLGTAIGNLRLAGTGAAVHYRSTEVFFGVLVGVDALLVLAGLLALGGTGPRHRRPRAAAAVRALGLPVAALPVASYLADLVPWERSAQPGWALAAAVAGADLLVTAVAACGPWRRGSCGPPLAVLAVTFITLVADVAAGSHLQLNGLLGYDAIVAGRFVGVGNLGFALLSTTGLLLAAALAPAAGRRARPDDRRRVTAAVTLLLGAVVVGIDGAPQLGRDLGGVLAAVPAFLLLALLLTGARVSAARLAAILGAAVAVVAALAVLDWRRPADRRTHLGRFVQQLLDGDAWTVISRKAGANLGILTGSVLSLLLPVALLAALWLVRPGGLLRGRARGPELRGGLLAVALDLALGAAVNDSGVAVPAAAAALLVPLLVVLAAEADPARTGEPPPRSGPGQRACRVTVGSRGSTVRTA
jgi:hypothetical protein